MSGRVPAAATGEAGRGSTRWRSRRIAAALVLAGIASGIVAVAHRSWKEGAHRSRFRPPFRPSGATAIRPDGSLWRMRDAPRRTILIYVRRDCPHCGAELRRWSALLSAGVPVPVPDVWVAAPRPLAGDLWLPPELRRRVLHDPTGSTARALGAEIVPTTAYVTSGGTVVALTRGQTPPERIRRLVLRLLESSDAPRS